MKGVFKRTWLVILTAFLTLLSLSFYMFHWRVANEPGASEMPSLLLIHRALLLVGGSGLILSSIRHFRSTGGSFLQFLFAIWLAVTIYLPILGLTALMMV